VLLLNGCLAPAASDFATARSSLSTTTSSSGSSSGTSTIPTSSYTPNPSPTSQIPAITFEDIVPVAAIAAPLREVTADFNNDGWLDFVVSPTDVSAATIYYNDGARGFAAVNAPGPAAPALPADAVSGGSLYSRGFVAADLNEDGWLDLLGVDGTTNTVKYAFNDATGALGATTSLALTAATFVGTSVLAADVDGDGHLDIVLEEYDETNHVANIAFRLGDGTGAFGAATTVSVLANGVFAMADVDGDGLLDLAAVGAMAVNTASVFINDGAGGFAEVTREPALNGGAVLLADADGDGNVDFLFGNGRYVMLTLGDGTGNFGAATRLYSYATQSNSVPLEITVVDFDADGNPDLSFIDQKTKKAFIQFRRTDGVYTAARVLDAGMTPSDGTVADYDRDGIFDYGFAGTAGTPDYEGIRYGE
jgi:hypothetical protein